MFWIPEVFDSVFYNTHTTIPLQDFWSDETLHQVRMHYYWPGLPVFVKDYCKSCTICSCTNLCATNLMDSQQLPIPAKALELHLHGFHRESPSIFQLYLDPSHCDRSQSSHSSSRLMTPLHLNNSRNYSFSTFSPSMAFQAMSLRSRHGIRIHFFRSLGTALDMKLHFTSRYHPKVMDKPNKLIRLWNSTSESIATTNKTLSELLPLAEFTYNNTPSATTGIYTLLCQQGLSSEPYHSPDTTLLPHVHMTLSPTSTSCTNNFNSTSLKLNVDIKLPLIPDGFWPGIQNR